MLNAKQYPHRSLTLSPPFAPTLTVFERSHGFVNAGRMNSFARDTTVSMNLSVNRVSETGVEFEATCQTISASPVSW